MRIVSCFLLLSSVAGVKTPLNLQPGFGGLILNFIVVIVVSSFTKSVDPSKLERFEKALSMKEAN